MTDTTTRNAARNLALDSTDTNAAALRVARARAGDSQATVELLVERGAWGELRAYGEIGFRAALAAFMTRWNQNFAAWQLNILDGVMTGNGSSQETIEEAKLARITSGEIDRVTVDAEYKGRKFLRFMKNHRTDSRSCAGFVDLATGDVLMAAGLKGPVKVARGNLFSESNGAEAMCSRGVFIRYSKMAL